FGVGSVLGTIVAGALVDTFGWRAVFWFRAPIALAAFALTWTFPRPVTRERQTFDAPGAALLVLAITFLLLTLNQLRVVAVPAWPCLAAALATIACVVLFIRREARTRQPIIDLRYFRDADFSLVTLAHAGLNLAAFSVMLLVPFYLNRMSQLSIP